jgi:hypothetical protein
MRFRVSLALLAAFLPFGMALGADADTATVRRQLEQLAQRVQYFQTKHFVSGRPADGIGPLPVNIGVYDPNEPGYWPESLYREHPAMLSELRALGMRRDALVELLKHPDAKVRTLALGALFEREDAHDLPAIVSLVADTAQTFPVFIYTYPDNRREDSAAQTVGRVAFGLASKKWIPMQAALMGFSFGWFSKATGEILPSEL